LVSYLDQILSELLEWHSTIDLFKGYLQNCTMIYSEMAMGNFPLNASSFDSGNVRSQPVKNISQYVSGLNFCTDNCFCDRWDSIRPRKAIIDNVMLHT